MRLPSARASHKTGLQEARAELPLKPSTTRSSRRQPPGAAGWGGPLTAQVRAVLLRPQYAPVAAVNGHIHPCIQGSTLTAASSPTLSTEPPPSTRRAQGKLGILERLAFLIRARRTIYAERLAPAQRPQWPRQKAATLGQVWHAGRGAVRLGQIRHAVDEARFGSDTLWIRPSPLVM